MARRRRRAEAVAEVVLDDAPPEFFDRWAPIVAQQGAPARDLADVERRVSALFDHFREIGAA